MDTIPLQEHIQALLAEIELRNRQRWEAQEAGLKAALDSVDKAITKSETALEKRLEGLNEFRGQLSDQSKSFITRPELNALSDRIGAISSRLDRIEGKTTGYSQTWGFIVGAVGLLATIITITTLLLR